VTFVHTPRPGYPPLDPERCKASVAHGDRAPTFHQCQRKVWKDGWCRQHHPDTEKAKQDRWEEEWQKQQRQWDKQDAIQRAEKAVILAAVRYTERPRVDYLCSGLQRAVKRLQRARKR
jgi:hypothetical protein